MPPNFKAAPEYATAKIAVWWDMKDCPIPVGYDVRRVRPSIEGAFKNLGYYGPVFITAYGDQTKTPDHVLRGLSSTGVAVAHASSERTCALMYSDMVEWRGHNPPPATIMFISDQVYDRVEDDGVSLDLARLQQETLYNIFLTYSVRTRISVQSVLRFSEEWGWDELLGSTAMFNKHEEEEEEEEIMISAAMFYCKSCNFDSQSLRKFRNHLSSRKHEVENPTKRELTFVTSDWGRNYPAKPEYATAKIVVWWDMVDCPIPEGFDATRVRPSLEEAFKNLGYSGPVSITAYGDLSQIPYHLLRSLSSTGVSLAHAIDKLRCKKMLSDFLKWRDLNPPPATLMIISNNLEYFSKFVALNQQISKYNMFLAYSYRPYKMLALVTSAEWLWESLLAGFLRQEDTFFRGALVKGVNLPECLIAKCAVESCIHERIRSSLRMYRLDRRLARMYRKYRLEQVEDFPKSKRLRKAFRTGFRPFHNHLRLTRSSTSY
ncbi:PREDICTED: uncharacterized protein LOC104783396 [Camelina sativa]|uniref:Uncharacterized protein LOC104783396 n=1 Tax=Camelina sativa TaxID=90675 RepID=A0ABM0YWF1_CAMSA|nr:PREDICTED: uncharacterized protein LOC104783396 [Camelina sativa]